MAWDPLWEDIYRTRPWGRYPREDVVRFVTGNFHAAPGAEDGIEHSSVTEGGGTRLIKHLLVDASRA